MNTKLLMAANALVLGLMGVGLSFLPEEIATTIDLKSDTIILQLVGALYLGFALLNWMNKEKILGGIYGRPIVMANFAHFLIGGMALIKLTLNGSGSTALHLLTIIYAVFGTAFAIKAFTHPKLKED